MPCSMRRLAPLLLPPVLLCGCDSSEITTAHEPHLAYLDDMPVIPMLANAGQAAPMQSAMAGAQAFDAMWVAWLTAPDGSGWVLKATGSSAAIHQAADKLQTLATSIAPDGDNQPTWTLPQGVTQLRGYEDLGVTHRFATFGADALEVAFSPAIGDAHSNINRWRGQLGLPPLEDAAQLRKPLTNGSLSGWTFEAHKGGDHGGRPAAGQNWQQGVLSATLPAGWQPVATEKDGQHAFAGPHSHTQLHYRKGEQLLSSTPPCWPPCKICTPVKGSRWNNRLPGTPGTTARKSPV